MTTVATPNHQDTQPAAALAIRPGQEFWTAKQQAALAVLGIRDASSADLAVFMHYCQKTGLDPFSRQIYMICRREKQGDQWVAKQTIQIGIDGFRVIRDRIAQRLGVTVAYGDTIWYDHDGREHNVWLSDEPPAACRVDVLKDGHRFPGVVRFSAYAAVNRDGDLLSQWRTQPDHMIEKCAEAFALRRAFPHDLAGVYLEDEMPPVPARQPERQRVTVAEIVKPRAAPADSTNASPEAENTNQSEPPPATQPQQASKAATDKLGRLLDQLGFGEEDQAKIVRWIAGDGYTATRAQVRNVTTIIEDHLKQAGGDVTIAAGALWAQYTAAQEAGDG